MSESQRMAWADELIEAAKETAAYLEYMATPEGQRDWTQFHTMWGEPVIDTGVDVTTTRAD